MAEETLHDQRTQILSGVVKTLLDDLKNGAGDKDRRRQVEEWMRTLAEKYPADQGEASLRNFSPAEAELIATQRGVGVAPWPGLGHRGLEKQTAQIKTRLYSKRQIL